VLLAEDDPIVRGVARSILSDAGYLVTEVGTGREGAAVGSRLQDLALLITDVVMPEMSGVELSHRLRERNPTLPVLYLSGYLGDLTQKYKLLVDRASFLSKPLSRGPLLRAVRSLLDSSPSDAQSPIDAPWSGGSRWGNWRSVSPGCGQLQNGRYSCSVP
jgi:CheY-like chemotaxis protein